MAEIKENYDRTLAPLMIDVNTPTEQVPLAMLSDALLTKAAEEIEPVGDVKWA